MKQCVSLLFMNSLFYDLNPRVNISLAGEIFPLQYSSWWINFKTNEICYQRIKMDYFPLRTDIYLTKMLQAIVLNCCCLIMRKPL